MFRIRGVQPLAYGVIEILVGATTMLLITQNPNGDLGAKLIGVVGGVYIIIRGLDNVERGLPPRLKALWGAVFPRRA